MYVQHGKNDYVAKGFLARIFRSRVKELYDFEIVVKLIFKEHFWLYASKLSLKSCIIKFLGMMNSMGIK